MLACGIIPTGIPPIIPPIIGIMPGGGPAPIIGGIMPGMAFTYAGGIVGGGPGHILLQYCRCCRRADAPPNISADPLPSPAAREHLLDREESPPALPAPRAPAVLRGHPLPGRAVATIRRILFRLLLSLAVQCAVSFILYL